jgi:hypothetical protein
MGYLKPSKMNHLERKKGKYVKYSPKNKSNKKYFFEILINQKN